MSRAKWWAQLALLALTIPCPSWAAPRPDANVVETGMGPVRGTSADGTVAFRGIPYAAPPTGELRWRPPQEPAAWTGVRDGSAFGNACIQTPGLSEANGGEKEPLSEDCLYLNVWTPKPLAGAKLPVIVWIHGGAYVFGSGAVPAYSGQPFAQRGAVVVTVNYRLAQLGFFAHPALEKSAPGGPVNFGLLDQIKALEWVKRNIAAFGGDPGNVTIMGQSAGAKSVLALFASPKARGLFHRGVASSSYIIPDQKRPKAVEVGVKVADALGLPGDFATIEDLRRVPAEKFGALAGLGLSNSPVPVAGDEVLPQSIQDTFENGKEAPLPLILGSMSDDASVALAFGLKPEDIVAKMGPAKLLLRAFYPKATSDAERALKATRDLVFSMTSRWTADRHAKLAPTWRFYFDYTAEKLRPQFPAGVPHGGEIVYLLNTGDINPGTKDIFTKQDRAFARRTSDYFLQFAISGTPSSRGAPAWPSHKFLQDRTLILAPDIDVEANFMRARLNTFIGLSKILDTIFSRN